MKNDIVIDLLKYGHENVHKGIEKNETVKYLSEINRSRFSNKKKYKNLEDIKHSVNTYFDRNFFIPQDKNAKNIGDKYFINPDGYFRYLQYKSIDITRKYSTLAIIIAILSVCFSLFNNKPVKISEKQINQLISNDSVMNKYNSDINENLNHINMNISNIFEKIDTIENINWRISNRKQQAK